MSWSWRIGRVAGIYIYVHATFLILLGWVGLRAYGARHDALEALGGVAFILVLFGIVTLHELAHALVARGYGIHTRDITLLPIGGVAHMEQMSRDPGQELAVAAAGPAVNLVLAAVIGLVLSLGRGLLPYGEAFRAGGGFLDRLFWVNVSLALFNLLPAFPMDGGRVLRALLATQTNYIRATQVAATVGQGIALLFALLGLFYDPMLLLIGVFVWFGAAAEASKAQASIDSGGHVHDRHGVGSARR